MTPLEEAERAARYAGYDCDEETCYPCAVRPQYTHQGVTVVDRDCWCRCHGADAPWDSVNKRARAFDEREGWLTMVRTPRPSIDRMDFVDRRLSLSVSGGQPPYTARVNCSKGSLSPDDNVALMWHWRRDPGGDYGAPLYLLVMVTDANGRFAMRYTKTLN